MFDHYQRSRVENEKMHDAQLRSMLAYNERQREHFRARLAESDQQIRDEEKLNQETEKLLATLEANSAALKELHRKM